MTNNASRLIVLLALLSAGTQAANQAIRPVGSVNVAAAPDQQEAPPTVADAVVTTAAAETPAPAVAPVKPPSRTASGAAGANRFNRLMRPPSQRNPPPAKDGIHDPDNDGTHLLQHPKESFGSLPRSSSGNRVDWVGALEKGAVAPRFDLEDSGKQPIVLDLNIVREVKGSMPDVVYPHKQHTEWLDCSNCHPAIFIPKKGANDISMASILLGEKCGVCHGKVAFPVSECRKCHSKNKPAKLGKK